MGGGGVVVTGGGEHIFANLNGHAHFAKTGNILFHVLAPPPVLGGWFKVTTTVHV